jgi:urease alpha subunit
VAESTVKLVAGESPNVTAVALDRLVPVITTLVPPAKVPLVGVNDEIVGGLTGPADATVDVATPMGRAMAAVMITAIKARPRGRVFETLIVLLMGFGRRGT